MIASVIAQATLMYLIENLWICVAEFVDLGLRAYLHN